jgi:hypothetical protein
MRAKNWRTSDKKKFPLQMLQLSIYNTFTMQPHIQVCTTWHFG